MLVSELGCWEMGLVISASDLSFWSWTFGAASFFKCVVVSSNVDQIHSATSWENGGCIQPALCLRMDTKTMIFVLIQNYHRYQLAPSQKSYLLQPRSHNLVPNGVSWELFDFSAWYPCWQVMLDSGLGCWDSGLVTPASDCHFKAGPSAQLHS